MWLQTKYGFYSVIEHRDDPDTLMVRARSRKDLVALCQVAAELRDDYTSAEAEGFDVECIVDTPNADYAHRLIVSRKGWMDVSLRLMRDIDYPNFKDAVSKRDPVRAHLYHDVWQTLLTIQHPVIPGWDGWDEQESSLIDGFLDIEPR